LRSEAAHRDTGCGSTILPSNPTIKRRACGERRMLGGNEHCHGGEQQDYNAPDPSSMVGTTLTHLIRPEHTQGDQQRWEGRAR
jgi:hypothetical protein